MSSLTPESRARSICRLVPGKCYFERAVNVFEKKKTVVGLQGRQNSKSNLKEIKAYSVFFQFSPKSRGVVYILRIKDSQKFVRFRVKEYVN